MRGELRLRCFNPGSDALARAQEIFLVCGGAPPRPARLSEVRPHRALWLARIEEASDRRAAERLAGTLVAVRESDLSPLGAGEYYHYQLAGLEVIDESGEALGEVREVISAAGNDVLVVDGAGRERMIPMVAEAVRNVDLAARRIVVRAVAGLFEP